MSVAVVQTKAWHSFRGRLIHAIQESSLRGNPPSVSGAAASRIPFNLLSPRTGVMLQYFVEELFETHFFFMSSMWLMSPHADSV
ncbi:unnamed protein product [Protopolystoma xenopodis]|uniref:Uncharacterized protein n=1 Tax=Protopolystoma xenopodis TaxID=117903 RepID=A0A3S5B9K8_9PLAT|nr:unnamed protein product [Protopolystoma xenopodis]